MAEHVPVLWRRHDGGGAVGQRSVDRHARFAGLEGWLPALATHVAVRGFGLLVLVAVGHARNESAYRSLTRWDADWYRRIAEHGYGSSHVVADGRTLDDYAFFPLYPALERLLAEVSGLRIMDAGLVISAVASMVAAVGIFKVGAHVYDERVGLILVAIWSALPISIVQSMAYSESLFTALVSWCLLATVRHRYVVAGVLASLAGLTRPSGGAVAVAVIVSAALHIRAVGLHRSPPTSRSREAARARLGALLAASGTLGFLGYVAVQTQDVLGYFKVADRWGNNVDGGAAFLGWIVRTVASERVVSGLLLVCSLGLLLVHLAWIRRYPVPILVFTFVSVAVTLSTSGYFGSKPRYLLPVFPLLLPLAAWLSKIDVRRTWAVLIGFTLTSSVYGVIWLFGPGPP